MKKLKRTLIIIVSILILLAIVGLSIFYAWFYKPLGKHIIDEWSIEEEFDISKTVTIEKNPNKDFVILNFADIQLSDWGDFFNRKKIHNELTELVERTQPDLITLTGDQVWSDQTKNSLKCLTNWLDSYNVPWAPVFGNHDDEGNSSTDYICDVYENSKNCVFKRGPSNLGCLGNYVINIMENGKVFKSLYMLNLGSVNEFSQNQKDWITWNAVGIRKFNGSQPEAMCFFHKPIDEFRKSYYSYLNNTSMAIGDVWMFCGLSYTGLNKGVFDMFKDMNVKDIVCGHHHTNMFTINYNGVRLTYGLKTGELCFYHEDDDVYLNGATSFVLSKTETKINANYVDKAKYHIKNSNNE